MCPRDYASFKLLRETFPVTCKVHDGVSLLDSSVWEETAEASRKKKIYHNKQLDYTI